MRPSAIRFCVACPHLDKCRVARRCALPGAAPAMRGAVVDDIPDPVALARQLGKVEDHHAREFNLLQAELKEAVARLDVLQRRLVAVEKKLDASARGWKVLR